MSAPSKKSEPAEQFISRPGPCPNLAVLNKPSGGTSRIAGTLCHWNFHSLKYFVLFAPLRRKTWGPVSSALSSARQPNSQDWLRGVSGDSYHRASTLTSSRLGAGRSRGQFLTVESLKMGLRLITVALLRASVRYQSSFCMGRLQI